MKKLLLTICFISFSAILKAQPCKSVKHGMTPDEVIKLVGEPVEIDSLGHDKDAIKNSFVIIWQYGEIGTNTNQRVEFDKGKVVNVIADGKK